MSEPLQDVVALVVCAGVQNARQALNERLRKSGAKVVQRLTKETTHVIFERTHSKKPSDKQADEAELLELYKKVDKVRRSTRRAGRDARGAANSVRGYGRRAPRPACMQQEVPPDVVSVLWVEKSLDAGRRLMEKKFAVARPKESLLDASPTTGSGERRPPARAASRAGRESLLHFPGPGPPSPLGLLCRPAHPGAPLCRQEAQAPGCGAA